MCPSASELQAIVEAGSGSGVRERITEHAETCDACRAALVALVRGNAPTITSLPAATPSAELAPGTQLDRYVIEGRLGAGAMGVVYAARDPELDRRVAIKLLHAHRQGEALRIRLAREARALARVSHPNVVTVHDVGTHGEAVFVAMELIRGETLRAWLARGQALAAILAALVAAGRGLQAAHEGGLVHRDFKPDNVLVGDDGRVRVTDFGLARAVDDTESLDGVVVAGSPEIGTLTATGSMVGTPAYAAPEQLTGQRVSPASDQYSFCVTAYEALHGMRPFAGETYAELLANVARGDFRAPPSRTVPPQVERALRIGLAAEPGARFPSMTALVEALLQPPSPPRRRRVIVAGGATALLAIAVPVAVLTSRDGAAPAPVAAACDARGQLASTWNPTLAAATPEPARGALARYADEWIGARDTACAASQRAPEVRWTSCLDGAMLELGAAVRQAKADPQRIAVVVEYQLPAVASCEHARGDVPALPPPAIAERVEAIRMQMADAHALLAISQPVRSAQMIATARTAAALLDYAPLEAELADITGSLAWTRGDSALAVASYREAIKLAETSRYDRLKASAAAALARVLVRVGRIDEAVGALDLAEGTLSRLGSELTLEAAILSGRAHVADARGQVDDAIRMYRDAITRFGARPRSLIVVATLQIELQVLLARIGRHAEAAELLIAARPALRALWGESANATHEARDACQAAQLAGELPRALEQCERHVIELELATPVDQLQLASALQALAVTHDMLGHWQLGHDLYLRSGALYERAGVPSDAAFSIENAGRDSLEVGQHDRAVTELQRSVALAVAAGERGAEQLEFSRAALGRALAATSQHGPAIEALEWALPRLEARAPAGRNALASAQLALAEALRQRSRPGDRARAGELAKLARGNAIAFHDSFANDDGLNAIYRRRMMALVARIDAWSARR